MFTNKSGKHILHSYSKFTNSYHTNSFLPYPGFNGTIHVVPFNDIQVPLIITVNSVAMEINPSVICVTPTDHPFTHYTYSVSHTPTVHGIDELYYYDHTIHTTVSGLSTNSENNLFTIGGSPCYYSTETSTSLAQPDFSGPAETTITYYSESDMMIECELPVVEPGVYQPVLHVAGRGWGLVANSATIKVYPSLELDNPAGSLRGGSLLEIITKGLSTSDITRLRVEIGNTPCPVQKIESYADYQALSCITQPARDDGYSSVVHSLRPTAYWSLQTDYYDLEGGYLETDGVISFRDSAGVFRGSADALVSGEVVGRKEGISGNNITNQAALFNDSYLEVPFHAEFGQYEGFGMVLWLKFPSNEDEIEGSSSGEMLMPLAMEIEPGSGDSADSSADGSDDGSGVTSISPDSPGPYKIVIDFATYSNGVAGGYVIVINPCGQPEFWLATGLSIHNFSANQDCPLLSDTDCLTPTPCSGISLVVTGYLPTGVWSVVRCGNCEFGTEWGLVSVGWEPDIVEGLEDPLVVQSGKQVFYFNNKLVGTATTSYSSPSERSLLLGGTNRLSVSEGERESADLILCVFLGYLDEVSIHYRSLSSEDTAELYRYGSTNKQKVWIRVEPVNGIGTGHNLEQVLEWNGVFDEVQDLDWNGVSDTELEIEEGKALHFQWTNSLRGVWQVTKATYESCDITKEPIREWSPPRLSGGVVVWADRGHVIYFIDPVAGHCLSGSRLRVSY